MVLDDRGRIYGFGFGVLEKDKMEIRITTPKLIDTIKFAMIDIFAGE